MTQTALNRREMLTVAAAATATYGFLPRADAAHPVSKNDRPHIAGIGLGGQGSGDLNAAAQFGDVVAVCDVDRNHAERAKARHGGKADVYTDYRELLERSDIDVIINGTPDHWHTAICVDACQSGKDVYTEKPMTLTIDEGKVMSKVVEETGRIVQVGTQQRSDGRFQQAVELVRNGRVGRLKQVWVALPYYSTKGGPFAAAAVPEQLDWDRYQGQAPLHDYCTQRTHQVFRWWYEYAGGIITDWGNHHVDIAHWGMDCDLTGPTSVDARGLFPNPKDPRYYNTPDRFFSRMQYANDVELLFFSSLNDRRVYGDVQSHDPMPPEKVDWLFGHDVPEEIKTFDRNGIMFVGDQSRLFVNRSGIYGKPVEALKETPLPDDAWRVRPSRNHMANFFDCVKTREEPVSPVRIQHRTITACHLTNISLRLGRAIKWDALLDFIRTHRQGPDGERPFYAQFHTYAVHGPHQPRADLRDYYKGKEPGQRHLTVNYAGFVHGLDQTVGRLIAYLEDPNGDGDSSDSIAEQTIVFFASDNGGSGGTTNVPLRRNKGTFYGGGLRVPLIAWRPGAVPAGVISDTLIHAVDFYPTLVDLAGGKRPDPRQHVLDGESFATVLHGQAETRPRKQPICYYFPGYMDNRAWPLAVTIQEIDQQRYKLLYSYETGLTELYDLSRDIGETKNLLDEENRADHKELGNQIIRQLNEWLLRDDPTWNPARMTDKSDGELVPIGVPEI